MAVTRSTAAERRQRETTVLKGPGFAVQGQPPQPGSKVREGGREGGEITSATRVPFPSGERILALGYLRRELAAPGTPVEIDGQPATVESLPFCH